MRTLPAARPPSSTTPSRRRALAAALLALGTAVGGLVGCSTLDEKQREWIFQPGQRTWWGGAAAAEGMQDVWITHRPAPGGEEVKLHALWLPQPRADAPLLLYLHGARFDVRGSAPRMRRMHELGFAVLGVDYRGFGRSSAGLPSEDMAVEDALAAWQHLGAAHPGLPRYVFGHSLGGALAVRLAAGREDVAGLIVEGSFTSIPDVFSTLKWGWLPISPFITQRFDAAGHIGRVKAPVLVVHGSQDTVIPPALGQRLYERAGAPKRFVLVDGGSHHSTNAVGQPQYRQALAELFGLRAPGEELATAGPRDGAPR